MSRAPKNPDSRLVYSTDPLLNKQCSGCKERVSECTCLATPKLELSRMTANLRLEKAGRGGKTVTVIDELLPIEEFLKELTSELKKKCGVGGTFTTDRHKGTIEIQGDKKDMVRTLLVKKGIKTKG